MERPVPSEPVEGLSGVHLALEHRIYGLSFQK